MIFHRLEKSKGTEETEYEINLVERHWLSEKKITRVVSGITSLKRGEELVQTLEVGFKNAIQVAELKLNQKIVL